MRTELDIRQARRACSKPGRGRCHAETRSWFWNGRRQRPEPVNGLARCTRGIEHPVAGSLPPVLYIGPIRLGACLLPCVLPGFINAKSLQNHGKT